MSLKTYFRTKNWHFVLVCAKFCCSTIHLNPWQNFCLGNRQRTKPGQLWFIFIFGVFELLWERAKKCITRPKIDRIAFAFVVARAIRKWKSLNFGNAKQNEIEFTLLWGLQLANEVKHFYVLRMQQKGKLFLGLIFISNQFELLQMFLHYILAIEVFCSPRMTLNRPILAQNS